MRTDHFLNLFLAEPLEIQNEAVIVFVVILVVAAAARVIIVVVNAHTFVAATCVDFALAAVIRSSQGGLAFENAAFHEECLL